MTNISLSVKTKKTNFIVLQKMTKKINRQKMLLMKTKLYDRRLFTY